MLVKFKIILLAFILAISVNTAIANDLNKYCRHITNKHNPSNEATLLALLDIKQGIAKVLVVGFPKRFSINLNDIDARFTKIKEEDFKCNYKNAGSIMYFDLNKLHMSAAYLTIKADSHAISKSVSFN